VFHLFSENSNILIRLTCNFKHLELKKYLQYNENDLSKLWSKVFFFHYRSFSDLTSVSVVKLSSIKNISFSSLLLNKLINVNYYLLHIGLNETFIMLRSMTFLSFMYF